MEATQEVKEICSFGASCFDSKAKYVFKTSTGKNIGVCENHASLALMSFEFVGDMPHNPHKGRG